jgi:hypothetical protein
MKALLLASAAAISLAVAAPAFAQTTQPLPATPPVVQPVPDPDATTTDEQQSPAEAQAPVVEGSTAPSAQAEPSASVEPPSVAAQASVAGEAQTPQTEPNAAPPVQSAETTTPAAPTTPATDAPTTTAQAAPPTQVASTEDTAETAAAGGATPAFASANAVCQPRTTSVHFGRSNALSRENQNAIEYAVDAASVCDIQSITIADSTGSQRRAAAVRETLVRQGVPEDRITIAQASENAEGAATGQLDVQMQFAGVTNQAELQPTATSGRNAAASPNVMVAEATPQPAPMPRAAPAPMPEAAPVTPDATTPAPETTPPTEPEEDSGSADL